jgi:uncharacterized protein
MTQIDDSPNRLQTNRFSNPDLGTVEPTLSSYHDHSIADIESPESEERRRVHLALRRKRESAAHYRQVDIWYKRYFEPGTWLTRFIKLAGLKHWMEGKALDLSVRSLVFEFPDLPEAFHGFRLLHLTDLHIDAHPALAGRVGALLQDIHVDLCLVTGDYRFGVVSHSKRVYHYLEQVFTSINSTGGVLGVLGNHDATDDVMALEDLGVRVLLNEAIEIEMDNQSIWIAGVDDPYAFKCDDLTQALHSIPESAFKILMAHTPQLYAEAGDRAVDLYLCGHTHGGQVCLPGIGPVISHCQTPRRYVSGLWDYKSMTGYTCPGVGVSGTVARLNCPPEIALIELRKA